MKLENKVYVYGFTMGEILLILVFFIIGLVCFLFSTSTIGLTAGIGIFACFVSAPIAFIKFFIHSKHEGYFLNLISYFMRPKLFMPIRNIAIKRRK